MEWCIWIIRWLFLCVRYSWLYRIYHLKKKETLTGVPPIDVYINRTNNRLVFKIKGRYYARITNA